MEAKAELEKTIRANLETEYKHKLSEQEAELKEKLSHQLESEFNEKYNQQRQTLQAEFDQKLASAGADTTQEYDNLKKQLAQEKERELKMENRF